MPDKSNDTKLAGLGKAVDQLRGICAELLGEQATTPLNMLNASFTSTRDLLVTCRKIESFTRLLVDTKIAEELGRRMRKVLRKLVYSRMNSKGARI